ncbi:hypothetical protein E2986_12756, partial [Frieseomelitta varia]
VKQIINLLLLNNFYPVISYRWVEKRKRRFIVYGSVTRYGPQSICQRKWLTLNVIFKRNKIGKGDNKVITSQSFLSGDIVPTIKKEKKAMNYFIRFESLVMVRNQLPASSG